MIEKYEVILEQAIKEPECFFYQKALKQIREDKFDDSNYIKSVFVRSLPTIVTSDQRKTMKSFAKELIKDKAILKEVTALLAK